MNKIKKVVGINLLILISYTVLVNMGSRGGTGSEAGLGIMLGLATLITIHVLANLVVCLVFFTKTKSELGKAFLLSAGIVLLIGFSSCWASMMTI